MTDEDVITLSCDSPSALTLRRAIDWAGSQGALAEKAGVTQQAIWAALKKGRVSAELAVAIEIGSGGEFKRRDFRPDIFDEPAEAAQ